MKLILLRHGESQWNLENRFTGWKDVSLSMDGIEEAKYSGRKMSQMNIVFNSVYTSILNRAIETTHIVSDIIDFPRNKIKYEWRLNERHYGALQGLNKSETAANYGEDQVQIWRRSYDTPPPLITMDDKRHSRFDNKFKSIKDNLPVGESLKDVVYRLKPFWIKYVNYIIENKGNHLIVAHSNSLRAIVKILDQLSDKDIMSVNIPTGVPLIYKLDSSLNVLEKKYLINNKKLKEKLKVVANQGKAE